jgi:hypothetical protein
VRVIIAHAARFTRMQDSGRLVGKPYLGITSGLPTISRLTWPVIYGMGIRYRLRWVVLRENA